MSTFARWQISSEPGQTRIEVNGDDVSGQVRRAALLLEPGPQIPALQLELVGGGHLEGVGIVKILPDEIVDDPGRDAAAVRDFLDALDPTELERRITAGPMNSGVGAAVLVALKQMAVR